MKRTLLAAAVAMAVPAWAFADDAAPTHQLSGPDNYSGYVFPNDGSPSGDEPTAVPIPQPDTPSGIPGLQFSHVYLYPPAQSSDDGNGS